MSNFTKPTCKEDAVSHDFENAIRKGRAYYVCPICHRDVTMELVLLEQMKLELEITDIEKTGDDCVVNKLID